MQAVKEKIQDMKNMRKAKAEARAEEQAENEVAEAKMYITHEVRMAREAEAAMHMHVNKAAQLADEVVAKHASGNAKAMEAANDPSYTAS